MTNRILSTGQIIFTPGLHTWPWDSGASERSARRAKKRAPSSWLYKVANDRAEIRELLRSSCRDSWHVTLHKNILDARVSWNEEFYVGHVFQRRTITFTLCHKTSKAGRLISAYFWSPTGNQADRTRKNFSQYAIYKKLEFTEINYVVPRILVILYNKNFKNSFLNICFVKTEIFK